jgi:hypothetical protein
MTAFNFRRLQPAPQPREVAEVVNGLLDGRSNNRGTVTLAASAASTAVTERRSGPESIVLLMPTTANASAEQGAGTIYISARATNSFTLTHANNSQTDRTFEYIVVG